MHPLTRAECEEVLRSIGGGCLERSLDIVLFTAYVFAVLASRRVGPSGMATAGRQIDSLFEAYNGATVRSWWHRLRAKGWIGADLRVTREGQRQLMGLLPAIGWHRKWDGRWYLVSFDIPERARFFRLELRETLKRLRFGKLHASTWISPNNCFGDVREAHQLTRGDRRIMFGVTERLGTTDARDLARIIWPLDALNERYDALRTAITRARGPSGAVECVGQFLGILHDDPQLPHALLPRPWYGFRALRDVERRVGPLPIIGGRVAK